MKEKIALHLPGHPNLTRIINRGEAWAVLGDFDALMKTTDQRLQAMTDSAETTEIAKLLHHFSKDHFYLFLVGQYKIKEIARGIFITLKDLNDTVLFNLTRTLVEHTAALAYQAAALEKAVIEIPKKPDFESVRTTVSRHHKIARRLYYNENAEVHVHDMIKALTGHFESARLEYDELCGYVHPNYGSNRLVSSGHLGAGQIRSYAEELSPELSKAHWLIERCALLVDDDFNKQISHHLSKINLWIDISCQSKSNVSQIFSIRASTFGDGKSKQTAIYFRKARTHQEQLEAFYHFLKTEKIEMVSRRTAAIEGGFLFELVATDRGLLWIKYRMPT